jgi:hypothetical protein
MWCCRYLSFLLLLQPLVGDLQELVGGYFPEVDRCTTIVVGARAGTEGPYALTLVRINIPIFILYFAKTITDCLDCDFRLNKVPAMDFEENEQRPLYE